MEAMRKAAGLPITILVWVLIGYGFLGYLLPQPLQAERQPLPTVVMYVYADSNGSSGPCPDGVGTLVLAFIMLGKLMEVTGATSSSPTLRSRAWGTGAAVRPRSR
jgi:TRAP-type uncharacterized transport system fused permease subunit